MHRYFDKYLRAGVYHLNFCIEISIHKYADISQADASNDCEYKNNREPLPDWNELEQALLESTGQEIMKQAMR